MGKTVRTSLRPEETYGYCHGCEALVRRTTHADCPRGHAADDVVGLDVLEGGATEPPRLPRFNWAAFLMPPVWGVGHGAWAGAFVLPLWLFTDSAIQAAVFPKVANPSAAGALLTVAFPVVMVLLTVATMVWFGLRGWGIAWRKVYDAGAPDLAFEEFAVRERRWLWISAPMAAGLIALAVYFWVAVLIPSGGVIPGK